jgi:integrase/recombinase XerD
MNAQQKSLTAQLDRYMLDAKARNFSPKTVAKMELGLRLFNDFMVGIPDVRRVRADDLRRFILDLQQRTRWPGRQQADQQRLADQTVRTYAGVVKEYWGWLFKKGIIAKNPMADVILPGVGKKLPRTFTEAEARSTITAAASLRSRVLVDLLLDAGPRLCEITGDDRHPGIFMEDIDFQTGLIRVRGKFGDERPAHFSPETIEVIRQYCQHERPQPVGPDKLLLNEDGTPMTGGRVQKVLESIGRKAGLKKRLSPHKLRHTHAILSLKYGSNVEYQRRELGHRHISTTQGYLAVCDDDLANAHKSYSPITNLLSQGKKQRAVMKFPPTSPKAGLERPTHGPDAGFCWEIEEHCRASGITMAEYLRS